MTARPRPSARIAIDIENPYARLGVSPLAGIDEIKRAAGEQRARWMAKRRSEGATGSPEIETKIIEVQDIENQIGTPAARTAYDREHPQNVLLTVQPGPRDRSFGPGGAGALITAWLIEQLGPEAMLVHPDAHWLWLPAGLDSVLVDELVRFRIDNPEPGRSHG